MIRYLSFILENITESAAKAIGQQRSLRPSGKTVHDGSTALDYLLAEQGGVWTVVNTTCCIRINTSGEVETQLHKITGHAT